MSVKKLQNLLDSGPSGALKKIIQTAKNMDSLTSALRAALEQDMADHLVAANVRDDGELVVICSSSAWASRIRFESKTLRTAAAAAGFDAATVRVSVSQGYPDES